MSALALGLVLLQTAAATPTPGATPSPTPRPAAAGARTLQDVARERRLSAGKGRGSLGTISLGPSTSSAAAAPGTETPGTASPAAAPDPSPTAGPDTPAATVRIVSASNDGIVDGTGLVRVSGSVRNAGSRPACNVVITTRILDSRGLYLASAQVAPDVAVIPPGEVVSFRAVVQAPPGVRGALVNPDRKDLSEGSTTMGGNWRLLGGTEASVASASEDCVR